MAALPDSESACRARSGRASFSLAKVSLTNAVAVAGDRPSSEVKARPERRVIPIAYR